MSRYLLSFPRTSSAAALSSGASLRSTIFRECLEPSTPRADRLEPHDVRRTWRIVDVGGLGTSPRARSTTFDCGNGDGCDMPYIDGADPNGIDSKYGPRHRHRSSLSRARYAGPDLSFLSSRKVFRPLRNRHAPLWRTRPAESPDVQTGHPWVAERMSGDVPSVTAPLQPQRWDVR